MTATATLNFDQPQLAARLAELDGAGPDALDDLAFGVIGFDAQGMVRRYNRWESQAAGLDHSQVLGLHLFGVVAQCMNNYLVAQRFEDSAAAGTALDETVDYVLTLRMRPCVVKLRLLAEPGRALRYICVERQGR
jgi:photoactive yellow protein